MGGLNFTRNQQLALIALVGLSLLGFSYARMRASRSADLNSPIVSVTERTVDDMEIDAASGGTSRRNGAPEIVVHVAGEVKNSGVYSMPPGSRVIDAIKAAGGSTGNADLDAINLAARLKDGERITVPGRLTETSTSSAPGASYQTSGSNPPHAAGYVPSTTTGRGLVNINSAGPAELDNLPGVGPATAQKIIEYRNRAGRFSSIEQLLEVKGIGPKKLEEMRPFVTL